MLGFICLHWAQVSSSSLIEKDKRESPANSLIVKCLLGGL